MLYVSGPGPDVLEFFLGGLSGPLELRECDSRAAPVRVLFGLEKKKGAEEGCARGLRKSR